MQLEIQSEFNARFSANKALKFVQVRVDTVTTCASVIDKWTTRDGVAMSKLHLLDPWTGTGHYPDVRIKDCSGVDGRCRCADEVRGCDRQPAEGGCSLLRTPQAQGAGSDLPDGNHGDNDFSASTDRTVVAAA